RRVIELEQELDLLKLILSLVDEELARYAEVPARGETAPPPEAGAAEARPQEPREGGAGAAGERRGLETFLPETRRAKKAEKRAKAGELGRRLSEEVLKSREGRELALFAVYERGLVIKPVIEVPGDSPPFLKFFIEKVLVGYRRADERAARYGDIDEGEKLDFEVHEEEGLVRRVIVWNWRERRRLEDIKGAVRWALSRVLERSGAQA
ncbi:MAG: hypothetical protein LM580_12080, partial [Thermofilum sp.]|nr:hypothetical protein [Thermofilum sp.]